MTDTRTPDEIERDIERERAELGHTVDELQNRFSPDHIMREIGRGLADHGSDIGTAISQSVKRNPVALALTGVGLAWLMSGRSWDMSSESIAADRRDRASRPLPRSRAVQDYDYGPRGSLPGEHARGTTEYGAAGSYGKPAAIGDAAGAESGWLWADDDDYWDDDEDEDSGPGFGERVSDAGHLVGESVKNAAGSVAGSARSASSQAASGVSGAASGVAKGAADLRDAASGGAASIRDGIASAGHSVAERAQRIRRRLAHGTESLTEEARERVVAARWAAVKARRAMGRRARAGADAMSDFYQENPLVVGGFAIAAGAALAGALPRTKQEDDYFGTYSDDAYDKAERLFQTERRKAMKVADRTAQTAQQVLKEERAKIGGEAPGEKSAAEHVADELRKGASRVAGAAKSEAEKQKLGKPTA